MKALTRLRENLGAGLKAYWGDGDWVSSNRPGNRWSSGGYSGNWNPGTNINYAALAGDLWTNSAVQACLNWAIRAWPESYPCVKRQEGKKKVTVDDHPLTTLLMNPNEADDDTVLWAGTIISFWCDGNAYWRINRTRGGKIGEFEYVSHWQIQPHREVGSRNPGADYYRLSFRDRAPIELDPWDVVHFRFGKDPYNDLLGMSPWASVDRDVYTDNEALNYTAATLKNRGAAWMIVSTDDKDGQFDDPQGVKDKITASTTGDNRNGILLLDGSIKVNMPAGMKDQGVDGLRKMSETRIAALAGFPAITVGLASGLEHTTFNNMQEAEAAAWQTIMSVQRMMGRQGTRQILNDKHNYGYAPNTFFIGFDYSEVRALQPDKKEEWERIGKAVDRNLLTDDEARVEMGYEAFTAKQRSDMLQQATEAAQAVAPPPQPGQQDNQKPPAKALMVGEMLAEIAAKSAARLSVYEEMFDAIEGEDALVIDAGTGTSGQMAIAASGTEANDATPKTDSAEATDPEGNDPTRADDPAQDGLPDTEVRDGETASA